MYIFYTAKIRGVVFSEILLYIQTVCAYYGCIYYRAIQNTSDNN